MSKANNKIDQAVRVELVPGAPTNVLDGVDKGDLGEWIVAAVEDQLTAEQTTTVAELQELDKQAAAILEKVANIAKANGKTLFEAEQKAAIATLMTFGPVKRPQATVTDLSFTFGAKAVIASASLELTLKGSYGSLNIPLKVAPPPEIKKLYTTWKKLHKAILAKDNQLMTIRRKLENMDVYARKARAAGFEARMLETPEGKKYLGEILKRVSDSPTFDGLQLALPPARK